jgi:16S rRNA (adenine1518-N6/adenine1519-N6)-dimethyltransferase
VGLQVVCRVESLFTVRAGAFQPPPAVHSAVIRLRPLAVPALTTPERPGFRAFVVGLFGQRRKQLARSLRDVAGLERDPAARLLAEVGIPPTARAETIPPAQLVALYRAVMRAAR